MSLISEKSARRDIYSSRPERKESGGGGWWWWRSAASGVQVLGEQQVVVRPGEVADQLLERVERHLTEAAVERGRRLLVGGAGAGRYDVPVHRAQVLEQVGLLLEHGHAQAARERLLARVHAEVRFQVPAHAELLAAVRALVLAARAARAARRLVFRVRRRRRGRRSGRGRRRAVLVWLLVVVLLHFRRRFGRRRARLQRYRFHVCGDKKKTKVSIPIVIVSSCCDN